MKVTSKRSTKVTATRVSDGKLVYSRFDSFENITAIKNDIKYKCKGEKELFVTYSFPEENEGDSFYIKNL